MASVEFLRKAATFQTPEELAELLEAERADLTKDDFFNNPAHQPIKDAWQAAVFGLGYQALARRQVEVRLSSQDRFPDFQLRVDAVVHDFESVMVVRRALGKRYRGDSSIGPVDSDALGSPPPFDVAPLRAVVTGKAAKHYQGRVHLLVYLNAAGAGGDFEALSKEVRDVSGDAFESVWLLMFGREAGKQGDGSNFIGCARPSPSLPGEGGWLEVPS